MRAGTGADGIERVEARFIGHGFDPHRHDTYAIGYTVTGVQAFRYRGAARASLPGQVFVLHPDETHDGRAGSAEGFRYRILYLAPQLIAAALEGPLPFWRDAVSDDARLARAVKRALDDLAAPLEELRRDQIVLEIAEALAADAARDDRHATPDLRAVRRARDYLEAQHGAPVSSATLEAVTGVTRYALTRHFRACLGTSPYRYLVMRRLDRARRLIRGGVPLVDAALASGFADQSHMTRQFKRAYGISPGRWAALAA